MEINELIGKRGGVGSAITSETFTGAFGNIEKELNQIAELVSDTRQSSFGGLGPNRHSLKEFLKRLKDGLDNKRLGDAEKGLGAITKATGNVQSNKFGPKSREIEKAVKDIKAHVEELRKKLLNERGKDIIYTLTDIKSVGLGYGEAFWTTVKGQNIGGLGSIQKHLQEQNEELPKQTKLIDAAIDDIRYELFQVGIRLNHKNETDDVIDQLDWLRRKIGIRDAKHGNLLKIQNEIRRLQSETFTEKPDAVDKAKTAIESELKRLRGVLEGERDNDVIVTLRDLRDVGLSENKWNKHKNTKGLKQIEEELKSQQESLTKQPEQINSGVNLITKQLDELRTALQSRNGNPKDDVINSLEDFLSFGLNGSNWQNGKPGLGQIKQDIQGQNAKLSQASDRIEQATDRVLRETEDMLRKVQNNLGPELVPYDTITSYLRQLKEKIGKENGNGEGLQGIQREISRMQGDAFKSNPEKIGQAEREIANGLRKLQSELDGHVTNPLRDVIQQGLGGGDKWNGHNAKSFDHIESNLERQQRVLTDQPEIISSGMKEITDELQSLRTELQGTDSDDPENRGVIKNLEFMTKQIGNNDDEGLKKIKREMESLKNDQGKGITDSLDKMSLAIQKAGAHAGWNLGQLEDPHIDGKLKDIQDGLTNLRLTDLAEAIKLCDNFLRDADEIEKNTIAALLTHVDDEVEDAIKDLTKVARTLYVDSVREALELFAKKVDEDLEQLPNEIDRDRYMGYKGFMKYLQGPLSSDLTGDEQSVAELSSAFQEVFEQMEKYVKGELTRLHDEQNRERNPSLPPTEDPYTPKLKDVYDALTALLAYLRDNDDGADKLTELVERLTKALGDFVPSDFKHPCTPLLDTVSRGLSKFACEFNNTYISAYSGQRCREEHAHKYAKVLLSLIPTTYTALTKLATKCESEWKSFHICELTADDRDNPLGNYLTRCGYRVCSSGSEQDAELNHMFTGGGIYELLTTPIEGVAIEMMIDGEPLNNGINLIHIISLLYNTLCHYFQVCHIYVSPEPRYPCTVRDMLSWLSGLQYTQVADKLPGHCKALLNRRCHDGDTPNRDDPIMAKCIGELPLTIARTCSNSTALLTVIQGNGHGFDLAAYPYSVDFSNNRARLHYHVDPVALLDMLREIACRLCRVLYFLYSQCCRSTARVKGWRECTYGRQVQSHHWQCNTLGRGFTNTTTTTTSTTTTSSTTTT
ncbi:hypothetical protein BBBOND_0200140 [Babesia bigemina]|uniref:Extracellular matrix-binding ebh n=1 Tax=Babesia bigemina TaxID=5866 RepID=A0A061D485_BABBI|nr:hypothetical protein BBBOND_0200140 [Babesia bigemina]CDR94857.1 hypothetical protein BBBOND_0200140 [Babesia bigemina]|eukprot:XP_012767043.1 hypothetical protein BBBOND_0200140 [Babesia bigemina]